MYNKVTMISGQSVSTPAEQPQLLHSIILFRLCASDRDNTEAWAEFLNRYANKIKYFIRGTIRQILGSAMDLNDPAFAGSMQESDLFQNTIIRLVENDCAAMKRFSGKTENELLAYLAVISRSTVMDALRRYKAIKRQPADKSSEKQKAEISSPSRRIRDNPGIERIILANELVSLIRKSIKSHSGKASGRDQLVFELYFFEGLSFNQISQCEGIHLSKAGVEKLLKRLISHAQESLQPIELR
jgi:RNA polymerase sigma factor (sigma-70 family)